VLAVIAPAVESADSAAEAGSPPSVAPVVAESPLLSGAEPFAALAPRRVERASRSAVRRVNSKPAVRAVRAAAHRSALRETARISSVRRAQKSRRQAAARAAKRPVNRRDSARVTRHTSRRVTRHTSRRVTRHASTHTAGRVRATGAMSAVLAYARAQVGKRYVSGGEGPNSFDCSGFTKRAYARAGLRLPHSSSGQAARARRISRADARPGDLVVGPGHVGIYMGGGMMIDAGNPSTGVVYRQLYAGLYLARF
jgi:cell wall-associated NlpC family hydrolase